MNWEDIIKNQIQVGRQKLRSVNKPSTSLRGKLRSDNQPLPDDDDNDCYEWLVELKRIVYEPLFYPYNNIFRLPSNLVENEDICCEIKRMLETETSYHIDNDVEFGLNHQNYGELWDLEVFAFPNKNKNISKFFRIDLSLGTIPTSEAIEDRYPFAIPWLMTRYIIVLQADADKDTNLQTTKHLILEEWEGEINKNLDKFNLFFDYIGNKDLREVFYYRLTSDVIEFLYKTQKDSIEDDAVFNRMYHYFISIITTKM